MFSPPNIAKRDVHQNSFPNKHTRYSNMIFWESKSHDELILTETNIIQSSMTVVPKKEPSPEPIPTCQSCGLEGILRQVRDDNPNGNAGRPYYKCLSCRLFLSFYDERRLNPTNPRCCCGMPSRRQMSRQDHQIPRGIHYVCPRGQCRFYEIERDGDGAQLQISRRLEDIFIRKILYLRGLLGRR